MGQMQLESSGRGGGSGHTSGAGDASGSRRDDGMWVMMWVTMLDPKAVRDMLACTAMDLEGAEETAVQLEPATESGGAVGDKRGEETAAQLEPGTCNDQRHSCQGQRGRGDRGAAGMQHKSNNRQRKMSSRQYSKRNSR